MIKLSKSRCPGGRITQATDANATCARRSTQVYARALRTARTAREAPHAACSKPREPRRVRRTGPGHAGPSAKPKAQDSTRPGKSPAWHHARKARLDQVNSEGRSAISAVGRKTRSAGRDRRRSPASRGRHGCARRGAPAHHPGAASGHRHASQRRGSGRAGQSHGQARRYFCLTLRGVLPAAYFISLKTSASSLVTKAGRVHSATAAHTPAITSD